jgi:hypothetical protein
VIRTILEIVRSGKNVVFGGGDSFNLLLPGIDDWDAMLPFAVETDPTGAEQGWVTWSRGSARRAGSDHDGFKRPAEL